jgi:hypothetical protein
VVRLLWALAAAALLGEDPKPDGVPPALAMTPAQLCLAVEGYGAYTPRPEAPFGKDEKLMLYFEPVGHEFERREGGDYRLHLTQDVEIRRAGQRTAVWKKADLVDYEATSPFPPLQVYLMNEISLKTLAPGTYQLVIRLHDRIGSRPPAEQVIAFTVTSEPVAPPGPPDP